jgi:hypothetical protein
MKSGMKNGLMLAAVAILIYVLFSMGNTKSKYTMTERVYSPLDGSPSGEMAINSVPRSECNMQKGTGLASSLLPREIASREDFGQFAPDDILAGQSYLEPRKQIGFPETIGGALRNANRTVRADPPNPKQSYVWMNSTIVPDTMQRNL